MAQPAIQQDHAPTPRDVIDDVPRARHGPESREVAVFSSGCTVHAGTSTDFRSDGAALDARISRWSATAVRRLARDHRTQRRGIVVPRCSTGRTAAELRAAGREALLAHLARARLAPRGVRAPGPAALTAAAAQRVAVPGERPAAALVRELATEALACRARLARLDREVEAALGRHPDAALIRSLPGMGAVLTAELIAEAGGLRRFRSADALRPVRQPGDDDHGQQQPQERARDEERRRGEIEPQRVPGHHRGEGGRPPHREEPGQERADRVVAHPDAATGRAARVGERGQGRRRGGGVRHRQLPFPDGCRRLPDLPVDRPCAGGGGDRPACQSGHSSFSEGWPLRGQAARRTRAVAHVRISRATSSGCSAMT